MAGVLKKVVLVLQVGGGLIMAVVIMMIAPMEIGGVVGVSLEGVAEVLA
jgi:hypothetical protein